MHSIRIDPASGQITNKFPLGEMENTDWEDIAQDENYIYLGDIGNNSGNRKDLHILRISKNSILKDTPKIDIISFSYPDQTDFTARGQATRF